MKLIEVKTRKESKAFLGLHTRLYKNEKSWIRPLDKDIENVFDARQNKNFQNGCCIRWNLEHDNQIIGRIAAFINERTSDKGNILPIGGVGFFECINNQEAANILLNGAKNWLEQRGIRAMDGPINFGDRDKWWGLLTKGFELEPNYLCNYHLPYYKNLFENYGFQIYFNHYTFIRNTADPFHGRIKYKADIIKKDENYHFEHLRIKDIKRYTRDIVSIYNKAWVKHRGVAHLTMEQGESLMNQLKHILDEKIVWFAYYKNEPIAFYINLPEVNQLLKHVNGKLDLLGKLKFIWLKRQKRNGKMLGYMFGVVPEHQGKGLDGALIMATAKMVQKDYRRYPILEINGIGDFNRKMMLVVKQVGGKLAKVHTTYRYIFDQTIPFERMPPQS